mgnify:CR=1 FL=1
MRYPSEQNDHNRLDHPHPALDLYYDDTSQISQDDMREYMARQDIQAWIASVAEADGNHTLDRIADAELPPPPIVEEIHARAYPLLVTYSDDSYTTWEVLLYTMQYYDPDRGHLSTALSSGPARSLRGGNRHVNSVRTCLVVLANRGIQNPSASQVIEEHEERYTTAVSRTLVHRIVTGSYYGDSLDRPVSREDGDEVTLYDAIPAQATDAETMEDLAHQYAVETGHEQTWAIILDEIYKYDDEQSKSES